MSTKESQFHTFGKCTSKFSTKQVKIKTLAQNNVVVKKTKTTKKPNNTTNHCAETFNPSSELEEINQQIVEKKALLWQKIKNIEQLKLQIKELTMDQKRQKQKRFSEKIRQGNKKAFEQRQQNEKNKKIPMADREVSEVGSKVKNNLILLKPISKYQ